MVRVGPKITASSPTPIPSVIATFYCGFSDATARSNNVITPCLKLLAFLVISSANEERFSKFFPCHIPRETVYVPLTETSTSPQLRCYTLPVPCEI